MRNFAMIDGRTIWLPENRLTLHVVEAGPADAEVVLLLHGWPTSSYLYRDVIPPLAQRYRVLALDLPGFGRSDKPLGASYGFRFFEACIEELLSRLAIERLTLAVHDLGGPIGLYWAVEHPERLERLILLNTVIYPEFSWAVKLFVAMTRIPGVREWLVSPSGLRWSMRFGVVNKERLTDERLAPYLAPFEGPNARRVLLKTGSSLSIRGFARIAAAFGSLNVPTRIVYGERDRILPEVAETMARVRRQMPHAEVSSFPDAAHFLQEDKGRELGQLLARFLDDNPITDRR
ncbi:MAG: alpha/beta fold hydrolase [Myxococcales bacterium]|nr:alpha/beta fold hydrolase [Myxococcales bacterium]